MQKRQNEADMAMIIKDVTDVDLFNDLRKMVTTGDAIISSPQSLTQYIRQYKAGTATLTAPVNHEVMNVNDAIEAAVARIQQQFSFTDEHIAAAAEDLRNEIDMMKQTNARVFADALCFPREKNTKLERS